MLDNDSNASEDPRDQNENGAITTYLDPWTRIPVAVAIPHGLIPMAIPRYGWNPSIAPTAAGLSILRQAPMAKEPRPATPILRQMRRENDLFRQMNNEDEGLALLLTRQGGTTGDNVGQDDLRADPGEGDVTRANGYIAWHPNFGLQGNNNTDKAVSGCKATGPSAGTRLRQTDAIVANRSSPRPPHARLHTLSKRSLRDVVSREANLRSNASNTTLRSSLYGSDDGSTEDSASLFSHAQWKSSRPLRHRKGLCEYDLTRRESIELE